MGAAVVQILRLRACVSPLLLIESDSDNDEVEDNDDVDDERD